MIFRQFLDSVSSTYSYLLADPVSAEAALIDPVKEQTPLYLQALRELGLKLLMAIDTHTHADHITALGSLRLATGCATVMGAQSRADCVTQRVADGDMLHVGSLRLQALSTPGHTDDSYSFLLKPEQPEAVFTGDVLLIRGTGRTDFQGGSPELSWSSISRLFSLPDATRIYPGHDYKGWTVSTIGEEKRWNPRLAGKTQQEYVAIMNGLNLPNPRLMEIAIPANLACGL